MKRLKRKQTTSIFRDGLSGFFWTFRKTKFIEGEKMNVFNREIFSATQQALKLCFLNIGQ